MGTASKNFLLADQEPGLNFYLLQLIAIVIAIEWQATRFLCDTNPMKPIARDTGFSGVTQSLSARLNEEFLAVCQGKSQSEMMITKGN